MKKKIFSNIKLVSLKVIKNSKGKIIKILNLSDKDFKGFGEAYISFAKQNHIKAWKKHKKMSLNLTILSGKVKFVFFDDKKNIFKRIILGENSMKKLIVPPGIWFGFKGLNKKKNIILNISNIKHYDKEILRKKENEIKYNW